MLKLKEDSVRVSEEGKLVSPKGNVIQRPAILILGSIMIRVGNYNSLFLEMLELEESRVGDDDGLGLHMLNLVRYPEEYFNIDDACYIIRRCGELLDEVFVSDLVARYGNKGFLDWFDKEKMRVGIQTRLS